MTDWQPLPTRDVPSGAKGFSGELNEFFYEDDEPIEDIQAIMARPADGVTGKS